MHGRVPQRNLVENPEHILAGWIAAYKHVSMEHCAFEA